MIGNVRGIRQYASFCVTDNFHCNCMGTYGIINGQKEEQGGIYDMTYAEIEFVVFCIEELAMECEMSGNDMYHLLAEKTARQVKKFKDKALGSDKSSIRTPEVEERVEAEEEVVES